MLRNIKKFMQYRRVRKKLKNQLNFYAKHFLWKETGNTIKRIERFNKITYKFKTYDFLKKEYSFLQVVLYWIALNMLAKLVSAVIIIVKELYLWVLG